MPVSLGRYCLISPCRDEAAYARRTLDTVTAQSVPPALWVIVDDGSTDQTPQILAEYAQRFDYIRIVRRESTPERRVGPGVIDAFYAGLDTVDTSKFDYLCKLDLDLELPSNYFEVLMKRMRDNPRIGTCSGKPYYPVAKSQGPGAEGRGQRQQSVAGSSSLGPWPLAIGPSPNGFISEACGDEMSVGMIKFYRRTCFEQIGGFVREVMWDGIDCHRCRMFGWVACSWDDPPLRFIHLRAMGSSHKGILTGRIRHGYGQYFMGSSLMYMTASALFRMTRPPRIIGGAAMWWGYVRSLLQRQPRYNDRAFRRFLRAYQWDCLLRGKARATQRLNDRQTEVWQRNPLNPVANRRPDDNASTNFQPLKAT